ncbi:unnamed protein product [Calypogeia fissa]
MGILHSLTAKDMVVAHGDGEGMDDRILFTKGGGRSKEATTRDGGFSEEVLDRVQVFYSTAHCFWAINRLSMHAGAGGWHLLTQDPNSSGPPCPVKSLESDQSSSDCQELSVRDDADGSQKSPILLSNVSLH